MRFDVNRLATLAGIKGNSQRERKQLNEAGNRSYHEDPGFSEAELNYINQLNEQEEEEFEDTSSLEEMDFDVQGSDVSFSGEEDVMLEINESDLRKEIQAMRKRNRNSNIQETMLRKAIRNEIKGILEDVDLNISGGWVYGKNKPRNSKKGNVARGFFGIGFK